MRYRLSRGTFWRHKSTKSTDFNTKRFLLLVLSVARTSFDDSTKIKLQILAMDFLVKYANIVFTTVPRKGDG